MLLLCLSHLSSSSPSFLSSPPPPLPLPSPPLPFPPSSLPSPSLPPPSPARTQLYLQDSLQETKELQLSQAKGTLIRHPLMLMELEEWEETEKDHTLLVSGQTSLVGKRVTICNVQTPWPRWIVGVVSAHNHQTRVGVVAALGPKGFQQPEELCFVHVCSTQ